MSKHNPFHDPNPCYLGDFVEHINEPTLKGRIYDIHYSCPESDPWLRGQQLLGPNPMQYKDDRWVSILIHEGGAIVVPDSFVKVIPPFPVRNNSTGFYFPLDGWVERDRPEPEGAPTALPKVKAGDRISTWGFEVRSDGDIAGLGNWFTGVVSEIHEEPSFPLYWYRISFDDGTTIRAVQHTRTKVAA